MPRKQTRQWNNPSAYASKWKMLEAEYRDLAGRCEPEMQFAETAKPAAFASENITLDYKGARLFAACAGAGLLPFWLADAAMQDTAKRVVKLERDGWQICDGFGPRARGPFIIDDDGKPPRKLAEEQAQDCRCMMLWWGLIAPLTLAKQYPALFIDGAKSLVVSFYKLGLNPVGYMVEMRADACNAIAGLVGEASPVARGARVESNAEQSKESIVLALLIKHPGWTETAIAEAAGCNRSSLHRMPMYKVGRRIFKDGKLELPRGSKIRKDGEEAASVEAWDEE